MTDEERLIPTGARPELVGVYLNDHLAGATGGTALARRIAAAHRGTAGDRELDELARDVAEDRDTLIAIMRSLDIPRTRYKEPLSLLAERLGRFKPNGSLLARSPLSSIVELEMMTLGVTGKLAGWRTLRQLCESEPRLDAPQLDALVARAQRQLETLERLRERAVAEGLRR